MPRGLKAPPGSARGIQNESRRARICSASRRGFWINDSVRTGATSSSSAAPTSRRTRSGTRSGTRARAFARSGTRSRRARPRAESPSLGGARSPARSGSYWSNRGR